MEYEHVLSCCSSLCRWFSGYTDSDFARSGNLATKTILIEKGPLFAFPHSLEPHLRTLNMPVNLQKGELSETCWMLDELGQPLKLFCLLSTAHVSFLVTSGDFFHVFKSFLSFFSFFFPFSVFSISFLYTGRSDLGERSWPFFLTTRWREKLFF